MFSTGVQSEKENIRQTHLCGFAAALAKHEEALNILQIKQVNTFSFFLSLKNNQI
jgi:hypothetical protein